ncbi:MAG: hypothetical protein AAFX87_23300 [Bacteroidota bacterium]
MINFFRKIKVNIDSISVPDLDWIEDKKDEHIKQWINQEQSALLSVNFFDSKPDIPTVVDMTALRSYYRNQIINVNGGLIQVDSIELKGYTAIKTIFKVPQEPSGMTYLASLTIPFRNCSYVVKIQAAEVGTTGIRDTAIADQFLSQDKMAVSEDGLDGWNKDPYDPEFKKGNRMNASEDEQYDEQFPDHPLSIARNGLKRIEKDIRFDKAFEQIRKFKK